VKIADALVGVRRLYIETAPFIYYVEAHPIYVHKMKRFFNGVNIGSFEAVTSVITLTEVLTKPLKSKDNAVEQGYRTLLQDTRHITLISVTAPIAERAADLRQRYNLHTPDALHLASAIEESCDAFLTNDLALQRVTELSVLALDDLELE
jgi:predicted nucleic acid-binding protein